MLDTISPGDNLETADVQKKNECNRQGFEAQSRDYRTVKLVSMRLYTILEILHTQDIALSELTELKSDCLKADLATEMQKGIAGRFLSTAK